MILPYLHVLSGVTWETLIPWHKSWLILYSECNHHNHLCILIGGLIGLYLLLPLVFWLLISPSYVLLICLKYFSLPLLPKKNYLLFTKLVSYTIFLDAVHLYQKKSKLKVSPPLQNPIKIGILKITLKWTRIALECTYAVALGINMFNNSCTRMLPWWMWMQRACLSNKLEKVSLSSEECLLTDLKWVLLGGNECPTWLVWPHSCDRKRVWIWFYTWQVFLRGFACVKPCEILIIVFIRPLIQTLCKIFAFVQFAKMC